MKFPRFVYSSPGPHKCVYNRKLSYDFVSVANEEEFNKRISMGWFASSEEAVKGEPKPQIEPPPTRAEMEQMARSLSIKFDGRTSDKKLLSLIKLEENNGME